jgi:hypothetical protein
VAGFPRPPAVDVEDDPVPLVVVLAVEDEVAVLDEEPLVVLDEVEPCGVPLVEVGPGAVDDPFAGRPDGLDLEVGSFSRLGAEECEPPDEVVVTSLGPTGRVSTGVREEDSAVGDGALPVVLHAATTPTTMATARKAAAAASTHGGTAGPAGGLRWRPVIASSRRPP